MSQRVPPGRATPRWSVASQASAVPTAAGLPVLRAGLPASRAWVGVGPPLSPRAPSWGLIGAACVPTRSPLAAAGPLQRVPLPSRT